MKKFFKYLLLLIVVVGGTLRLTGCDEPQQPTAIDAVASVVEVIGESAGSTPLSYDIPGHPFMAAQGVNSMHSDGYSSDVHPAAGPLGINTRINSRDGSRGPGGQCATLSFSSEHRLVALCTGLTGFRLNLLVPRTLELLAEYKLPVRPSTYESIKHQDKSYVMKDSSGAYFYLDDQDRVVLADSRQRVRRIGHRQNAAGEWEFYNVDSWDLSGQIPHDCVLPTNPFPEGECDPITAVMPDHGGSIWFVTRRGRLGTLDVTKSDPAQAVKMMQLDNEEIQNGFTVSADGVFIVSDHAMYRFTRGENGEPLLGWRETYDRGQEQKVGSINQGSGTTPTLLGDEFVTITDNADGRINLLVYQRQQAFGRDRLVCKVPLFESGHSATDNSMIATGRSIVIENNAGYQSAFAQEDWNKAGGGIMRIDINDAGDGCELIWHSQEMVPSVVAKLSAANGLAYYYTYEPKENGLNDWSIMALDFHTGETRFKLKVGEGKDVDNNWSPLTIAPDGTVYVGVLKGLVAVWDEPVEDLAANHIVERLAL